MQMRGLGNEPRLRSTYLAGYSQENGSTNAN